MTEADALAFWYGRINYEVRAAAPGDLKLERMRGLLRLLGDPHDRLRIVHITGTKGKGSTAAMLAAVLRAAGYRIGLFTSPHLTDVHERIQVDGEPISPEELAARMEEIAAADRSTHEPHTFFEIGTALGFLHFLYRRCDVAVVEVGLGGRFDSTNVCRPLVSLITNVGYDHMAVLGHTLEAIAGEKAGIIKPGVPVVSGVTDSEPPVIRAAAVAAKAPLWELGSEFGPSSFPLALRGAHQAANAGVAAAAVEWLRRSGLTIPDAAVRAGFASVRWPARIEEVARTPTVILDTAHNVASVETLIDTLREEYPAAGHKSVVFAVSADKQVPDMLGDLAGYFDHIHLTKYGNNPRSVPPEKLAEMLKTIAPGRATSVHSTSTEAWTAARAAAGPADLICVTGSVFLAGELRPTLMAASSRGRSDRRT